MSDYTAFRSFGFDDPDEVGSSEFRAMAECIDDALNSLEPVSADEPFELVEAMLQTFMESSQWMLNHLRKRALERAGYEVRQGGAQ